MIAFILLAAVQPPADAPATPAARTSRLCRGVHMPDGQGGGANLLATTIRGPEEKLRLIAARMEAIGARVTILSEGEIRVGYTDNLDARAIAGLLNAIDRGEFGPVTTDDFAMGLETLPADRCIRFRGRP
jgi:hypothetical protein